MRRKPPQFLSDCDNRQKLLALCIDFGLTEMAAHRLVDEAEQGIADEVDPRDHVGRALGILDTRGSL